MRLGLAIAWVSAVALGVVAQNAPVNTAPAGKTRQEVKVDVEAPRAPKTSEVSTNALSSRPAKEPKEPTASYGGLATDIRKSTNRWKMFSLRRPANLKEDEANMVRNMRTEAGGAVKLMSVDF